MQNQKTQMKQMNKINKSVNELKRLRMTVFDEVIKMSVIVDSDSKQKDEFEFDERYDCEVSIYDSDYEEYKKMMEKSRRMYEEEHDHRYDYDDDDDEEDDDDDDRCKHCGWMCEFPESHVQHSMWSGCEYIESKYDVWRDEDGEIEFKLKF
jgi:hypothetical protein